MRDVRTWAIFHCSHDDATILSRRTGKAIFEAHRHQLKSWGLSDDAIRKIVALQDDRIRPIAQLLHDSHPTRHKFDPLHFWVHARDAIADHIFH